MPTQQDVEALEAQLQQMKAELAQPRKRRPLNYDDAIQVTFRADLSDDEKVANKSYLEKYDNLWFRGSYQVKGPETGLYCYGVAVLGRKETKVTGVLKISNKGFLGLQAGGTAYAWFTPKGETKSLCIGVLSNFKEL
jgi:hypothetical protein